MAARELDRAMFIIVRRPDGWAVEHEGEIFDASVDKDVVRASAHKRARAASEAGRPSQVCVPGEHTYLR